MRSSAMFTMFLILLCIGMGILVGEELGRTYHFNRWVSACRIYGGIPKESFVINRNKQRYDCYKDNKIVIVPGWESEEKSRP